MNSNLKFFSKSRPGIITTLLLTFGLSTNSYCFEKLDGYFIAFDQCEAFQSKKHRTNPGDVTTSIFHAYTLKGLNKKAGDFFLIQIPDAPVTEQRWVSSHCGIHVIEAQTAVAPAPSPQPVTPTTGLESESNLLALSWQPAFCEKKPNKTECQQLNHGLLPITETRFSIHGLWPQPRNNIYCGVPESIIRTDKNRNWSELPMEGVDPETLELLAVAMPGVASSLERHEWIKHGTCYRGSGGADEYFDDTLLLLEMINSSPVATFVANHLGAEVSTHEIRDLFDETFGQGAGDRVQFHCTGDSGRVLIQEMKLHLQGIIQPGVALSKLLKNAAPVSIGCQRGVIDAAGLQ